MLSYETTSEMVWNGHHYFGGNEIKLLTHIQKAKVIKSHYATRSASEKRRSAWKSCVSKFLRNSLLLQSITDSTYTRIFQCDTRNTKTLFVSVFLHHRFVYCLKFSLPDRIFSEKKRLKSRTWSEFSIKVMRDKKHKNVSCDNLSYTLTMMIIKQFMWKTSSCDLSEVMKWKFSVEWERKSFSPRDVTILFESVFPQWKVFLFFRKNWIRHQSCSD